MPPGDFGKPEQLGKLKSAYRFEIFASGIGHNHKPVRV
jgi:hypothetical protein